MKMEGVQTRPILRVPMTIDTTPAPRMSFQKGRPISFWRVDWLFSSPRVEIPSNTMVAPRVTKPESSPSRGQFRSKYALKTLSSETMRNAMDDMLE